MKTKKESSVYNIALVHFLTSIILSVLISFIAVFIVGLMFGSSSFLFKVFPLISWGILALTTAYSTHYINTTYVVMQPRKVVRASVAYYAVALIVLNVFLKNPQDTLNDSNMLSVFVALALFYAVSHWKIKGDVVTQ